VAIIIASLSRKSTYHAVQISGAGSLYAVAAFEAWFKQYPKWWLIVLPAVLAIVLAVASFIAGTMAIAPLLLNVIVLVLIPLRVKHRNALSAIPKA
jgi:hypothetical protein